MKLLPSIYCNFRNSVIPAGIRSNILLKTNVTALSSASCNNTFRDLHAGQLCAHDPSARNDACQGDSGGPLQIVDEANMSTVVGIVSFGMACGTALPAVYARVAAYLSWMEPIVWPNAWMKDYAHANYRSWQTIILMDFLIEYFFYLFIHFLFVV